MEIIRRISPIILQINLVCQVYAQPTQWLPRGIGGGGALFSPSISPHDDDEVFLACDMTDLFHSVDAGRSWEVVPFDEIRTFPDTKVQFTSDANIMYAIHFDFPTDERIPVRSNDGGQTWSPISTDPTQGEAYYLFADINRTDRLIVSNYDQIFFSTDAGQTFTSIYFNNQNEGTYIGGVFFDGQRIFIAVPGGILVSTDNGVTFDLNVFAGIPENEGIVSFSASRQGEKIRFFCVTLNLQDIYPTVTGAEHWGYRNCYVLEYTTSSSWISKTNGLLNSDHPFYVIAHPNDLDVAYLGGGNGDTFYPIIYKTEDGGDHWQEVFKTVNNENIITGWSGHRGDMDWWYGEYVLGLAMAPSNPEVVIFTDLGYAHRTSDGGQNWHQMYVDESNQNPAGIFTPQGKEYRSIGLENTSCWWLTWLDSDRLFASFTDVTAIRSEDGGESWSRNYRNLDYNSIYQTIQHPETEVLYAAASSIHDIYQSTYLQDVDFEGGEGAVMISQDGGEAWETLHDFGNPVVWVTLDHRTNDLYACVVERDAGGIYRTSDLQMGANASWTKLAEPPRTEGHPASIQVLSDGTLVTTYSGRRDADGSFTRSSGVFLSNDGGRNWLDRSDPGMHYWTRDLVVDPHDPTHNTWYVGVFSGWGGPSTGLGGLYRTFDRGLNWHRVSDLDRVESCSVHPANPDYMYVTTEANGLWYTSNLSASLPTFIPVTSYPFQHPVRIFFDPDDSDNVWVTSFGNGLRVGRSSILTSSNTAKSEAGLKVSVHPNPVSDFLQIRFEQFQVGEVKIAMVDLYGREVATHQNELSCSWGQCQQVIPVGHLHSGTYLLRIVRGEEHIVRKISILK